jgi:hypothetical protein
VKTRQLIDVLVIIRDHNETLLTYALQEIIPDEKQQDAIWDALDARADAVRERP